MNVEYLDAYAKWQPLENATAVQLEPGVYEVTIAELSPTWKVSKDLFDGSLLRVNGVETNQVVGMRHADFGWPRNGSQDAAARRRRGEPWVLGSI
jgi:hypothetical protein